MEDANHQSVDIVFDSQHDVEHQDNDDEQPEVEHEHQFHAHTSCITGYGISVAATPVILASTSNPVGFGQSLTHQPPVPPPNP